MADKFSKYKDDLERLNLHGTLVLIAFEKENFPEDYKELYKGKKFEQLRKNIPTFSKGYQSWYSEAKVLIKQLLPERLEDFTKLYEKPRTARKDITFENYSIEDALTGLVIRRSYDQKEVAGPKDVYSRLKQQLHILEAVERRFESSLFDIKQLVQADLFDTELDASKSLIKKGFIRAAGAVAGVVLEAHLKQVCENHKISIQKKNPSIADFNDKLNAEDIIETPMWRKIQHLADVRNTCDHKKSVEPSSEDVEDMIAGVDKVVKNLF